MNRRIPIAALTALVASLPLAVQDEEPSDPPAPAPLPPPRVAFREPYRAPEPPVDPAKGFV